jgi:tetratricopeptide (TPR) repeat protein
MEVPVSDLRNLARDPAALAQWPDLAKLVEIGLFAAHSGQVARARALFEGLLQAVPNRVSAKVGLHLTELVVNDFAKAEDGLREVLAGHPDHAEAKALLGLCLALAGRTGEAGPVLGEVMAGSGPAAELARVLTTGL